MLAAALCLGIGEPRLHAQSSSQTSPAKPATQQEDNPFPGNQPNTPSQTPPKQSPAQAPTQGTGQQATPKPAGGSDNPFPGENSDAPIIPVDPGPDHNPNGNSSARPGSSTDSSSAHTPDPDGDPVRSPDLPGQPGSGNDDDGFSSSRSGLNHLPAEDDSDARPGKSVKNKTREQVIQEDLDVGGYYMSRKNWKAAQARFASAFALDSENSETVWELAEAERHLQMFKEATDHYKLFLSYDPDGPHGKQARKALDEVESALPPKAPAAGGLQPR
jgi:hypothetical protein